jgi:hypothetical protein
MKGKKYLFLIVLLLIGVFLSGCVGGRFSRGDIVAEFGDPDDAVVVIGDIGNNS